MKWYFLGILDLGGWGNEGKTRGPSCIRKRSLTGKIRVQLAGDNAVRQGAWAGVGKPEGLRKKGTC